MSLGTDQGSLMSTELPRVAERAQHDPESGGRHPGVFTPDPDQGVVLRGRFAPAPGDGASVTWRFKGSHDALVRRFDLKAAPKRASGIVRLLQRRSRVVEISLLGSEGARAGNRPGYPTSRV